MSGTITNLASLVFLGFFLGMRHATDADHVVAIAAIVSRQRTLRGSALIGGAWGVGHTRLLEQGDQEKPDYRALQPFGQVPILEEDGFVLFESGAIVLYVGERSEALLPRDVGARARAMQWLIAALNSIEPFVMKCRADRSLLRETRNGRSCAGRGPWSSCESACRPYPNRSATSRISTATASRPAT